MANSSNISRRRKSALAEGSAEYAAKRQELVSIAAALFKEQGFKATTLADIGQRAGLDRATLYYYVGSKEELFQASAEGILDSNIAEAERLLAAVGMDPRARLTALVRRLMTSYVENYPHMYVYIQEQMHQVSADPSPWAQEMQRKTRRFEAAVTTIISEGITDGVFRDDIGLRLATNALFGMFNWTHRWFNPEGRLTAEAVVQAFCNIFFEGMEARDHKGPAKPQR